MFNLRIKACTAVCYTRLGCREEAWKSSGRSGGCPRGVLYVPPPLYSTPVANIPIQHPQVNPSGHTVPP